MRASSPVLPVDRRRTSGAASPRCSLHGFPRSKSPAAAEDVPLLLLRDMNFCYRLLRRLVPGLQPGQAASRVEILQHAIDYILDLQAELQESCPDTERPEPPRAAETPGDHRQPRGESPSTRATPVSQSRASRTHGGRGESDTRVTFGARTTSHTLSFIYVTP